MSDDHFQGCCAIGRNEAVLNICEPGTRLARPRSMSFLRTFSLIVGGALLALGGSALATFL
jgi:hypothetical protein